MDIIHVVLWLWGQDPSEPCFKRLEGFQFLGHRWTLELRSMNLMASCRQIKKTLVWSHIIFSIFLYLCLSSAFLPHIGTELLALNLRLPVTMWTACGTHGSSCLCVRTPRWSWSWTSSSHCLRPMFWRSCRLNWLVNGKTSLWKESTTWCCRCLSVSQVCLWRFYDTLSECKQAYLKRSISRARNTLILHDKKIMLLYENAPPELKAFDQI